MTRDKLPTQFKNLVSQWAQEAATTTVEEWLHEFKSVASHATPKYIEHVIYKAIEALPQFPNPTF